MIHRYQKKGLNFVLDVNSGAVHLLDDISYEMCIRDRVKDKKGVKMDNELDADDMSELIVLFKDHYKKSLGEDFPQDPKKQRCV